MSDDRPAADGLPSGHYTASPVAAGHVEPAPRRVRGIAAGRTVFDTLAAHYLWEHPYYPQYMIPPEDLDTSLLVADGPATSDGLGVFTPHALVIGAARRNAAAQRLDRAATGFPHLGAVVGSFRFSWPAIDEWYEEDERIVVHPRSPYTRVDAVRSLRRVRVSLGDHLLADAPTSVIVFETGLPPRYYLDRSTLDWSALVPSTTVTSCPYKGTTSGYWSADVGGHLVDDVAWSYDHPTLQLTPIAGLVAFFDERVDIEVDPR